MKLKLRDVLTRAHQRGYSADEIRPCLKEDLGGGWYDVDVDHPAYPRTAKPGHTPQRGLGDYIAAGLTAFGITEERVSAVVGGDCGCKKRRAAANLLGAKYLGLPPGLPIENQG